MIDYKARIISGDVTTGALQEKSLEIFKYFQGICREHNLRYWVGGGTLIGALRHGQVITRRKTVTSVNTVTHTALILNPLYDMRQMFPRKTEV